MHVFINIVRYLMPIVLSTAFDDQGSHD